jgi:glycosyltransferase involved in cell wall biosynthesis
MKFGRVPTTDRTLRDCVTAGMVRALWNTAPPVELPSISIVTPCLNAVDTIEEAVESVRAQAYPGVEHVVVDGGSTDGTVELLDRLGVRYVSEPDDGRVDAANKGVALTSGEVVAWLNADDRYEPGALLQVGRAFAADPDLAWVTGYCRIIDGDGREIRKPITAYKNLLLRHWSYPLYLTQNFVSDPATFVRRAALREAGELDPRYRISHDYDLWLRVGRRHRPAVLRQDLSSFRMVEGTLSMAGFERQFREHTDCARRHGHGHRLAVAANVLISRLIVGVYKAFRFVRTARAS